jgi:hypothetical protein
MKKIFNNYIKRKASNLKVNDIVCFTSNIYNSGITYGYNIINIIKNDELIELSIDNMDSSYKEISIICLYKDDYVFVRPVLL